MADIIEKLLELDRLKQDRLEQIAQLQHEVRNVDNDALRMVIESGNYNLLRIDWGQVRRTASREQRRMDKLERMIDEG